VKPIMLAAAAAVVLFAAGCDAQPEFPSAPASGIITVRNMSSVTFHVLRFRPSDEIDWSRDYLGSGTVIPAGGGEVSYHMPVGTFDFLVENIFDEEYVEFKNIPIIEGREYTLTIW